MDERYKGYDVITLRFRFNWNHRGVHSRCAWFD